MFLPVIVQDVDGYAELTLGQFEPISGDLCHT